MCSWEQQPSGGGKEGMVSGGVLVDVWVTNASVSIFSTLSVNEKKMGVSVGPKAS